MKEWKLKYKNKWGTYEQFTDELGTQEYKKNIAVNHMTGEEIQEWQNENWEEVISFHKKLGWRNPTIEEMSKITNYKHTK